MELNTDTWNYSPSDCYGGHILPQEVEWVNENGDPIISTLAGIHNGLIIHMVQNGPNSVWQNWSGEW